MCNSQKSRRVCFEFSRRRARIKMRHKRARLQQFTLIARAVHSRIAPRYFVTRIVVNLTYNVNRRAAERGRDAAETSPRLATQVNAYNAIARA